MSVYTLKTADNYTILPGIGEKDKPEVLLHSNTSILRVNTKRVMYIQEINDDWSYVYLLNGSIVVNHNIKELDGLL